MSKKWVNFRNLRGSKGTSNRTIRISSARSRPRGSRCHRPEARIPRLLEGLRAERPQQSELASPIRFVGPGDAPLLLIHGETDPVVDRHQFVELHRAYTEAGLEASPMLIPETGHMDLSTREPKLRARV